MAYTEFLRITNQMYKDSVFYKIHPELYNNGYTKKGVLVGLQLLGSDGNCMAENAHKAVTLGAKHIDINFGCPARKVNNSGGGAELLKCPDTLYNVVHAVRCAVPPHIPVSVKMRLGYNDTDNFIDNIRAVTQANPTHITIHARTKAQQYRGHADWDMVANAQPFITCPLFINGDITDSTSAKTALKHSMADGITIGRGACQSVNLGNIIRHNHPPYTWDKVLPLIQSYVSTADSNNINFVVGRVKQWLGQYLQYKYRPAQALFDNIKTLHSKNFLKTLDNMRG